MIEELGFTSPSGQRLAGSLHLPEGGTPTAAAVVCHGMLSSRSSPKHEALCAALSKRGLAALRFDFSGRGDSEGRLDELCYHRQVEEVGAAMALVGSRARPVALVGSSMGGAVALLRASRDPPVAAVAGLAAVGRPGSITARLGGPDAERRWEAEGFLEVEGGFRLGLPLLRSARQVDVVGAARQLRCPLLLVHGSDDEIVPLDQAVELHNAAAGSRLEVLRGADHVFSRPGDRRRLVQLVAGFVVRAVAAAGVRL